MNDRKETRFKILFIDDEPHILRALEREFYNQTAYNFTYVSDDRKAYNLVQKEEFAIVISDYLMPYYKGTEILAKVYEHSPRTRRILLTGFAEVASQHISQPEQLIHQYIEKPWDKQKLLQCLDEEIILYQSWPK
ncbi:MAG: response regulator [SAR324 cluster bacterium]|nr:response regulator [SAR324 cluster bacterium]